MESRTQVKGQDQGLDLNIKKTAKKMKN